jgi:chromosome segregation ATPase
VKAAVPALSEPPIESIRDHLSDSRKGVVMTIADIESLSARRERLHDQLVCLQAQHDQLIADARLAQDEWATAVVDGKGTAFLAERSRHCRVAADDCAAAIAVVSGQLAEVDRQLAELHTHADLDAQLRAHATAADTFTERLGALTRIHEVAVNGLIQLASELHELHDQLHTALREGEALNAQAAAIRARAAELQRSEQADDAPYWKAP